MQSFLDLPTPITCKSGGFEKSPEKPGDWVLRPGDFQNMHQVKKKKKQIIWVFFYLFSWGSEDVSELFCDSVSLLSSGQRVAILKFVHAFEG